MSAEEAKQTVRRSTIGAELQIIPKAGSFYLKRVGRENVEPRFLCKDGRWRRYDLIPELPGSAAAS